MDDLLPSYESVTQQSPWELIAPYLSSDDLCSVALVCQKWHEIFTPQLWGDPASHFGVQNDTVYVALTRFRRTLHWARLSVRELTYTLHLPPAHSEIYGGPHSEWLRDCLERLPRLQSLIVDGLPFFDHASLLTLRHSSLWWRSIRSTTFPVFGLRLLDASYCANATSIGLSEALSHLQDLVSLDLSKTVAAKDEIVLRKLKVLRSLRVLKLKGLGLKDSDFSTIASSIGTRVRSLDVSENLLSDKSARLLLDHCIREISRSRHSTHSPLAPVENTRPHGEMEIFGTEDLDSHLRKKLTRGFVGSLAIEDARDIGITHLCVSDNLMTVEGISGLLRSGRLQALNVGTLPTILQKPSSPFSEDDVEVMGLPGVEKLTPILANCAADKLVYLRLHFGIITEDAPPMESLPSPPVEVEGSTATYCPSNAQEVEAGGVLEHELDTTEPGVYELPGDSPQPAELSGVSHTICDVPTSQDEADLTRATPSDAPIIEVTSEPREINRGPAYAPEPVFPDRLASPVSPLASASGGLSPALDATGGISPSTDSFEDRLGTPTSPGDDFGHLQRRSRQNSAIFVEDRRARLDLRQSQEHCLHPGMLPKIHTLVLTGIPTSTDDRRLVDRLIHFISDCAEEATIATLRAKHTYMLPPGRTRNLAEREYARSLFALRRIVLEMAGSPQATAPKKISASWRQYPTKSSTEDTDSEAFWDAAAHDFSFFSDEECGLPTAEPARSFPLIASGLILASGDAVDPPPRPSRQTEEEPGKPVFDVVAEISSFRRERKAEFDARVRLGEVEPLVEGFWSGEITVVRKVGDGDGGSLDYYGNKFVAGWLYR